MTAARVALDATVTEKQFQTWVLDVARLYGWSHYHPYDSRRSNPGWPDLVLWRPPEIRFVELKTERGRVSPAQARTHVALRACGLLVDVWRPSDAERILEALR